MRDDDRTMSVHRAVASKSDDERRLLQECRGMSDDERKAFSSKGVYLERNRAYNKAFSSMSNDEQR